MIPDKFGGGAQERTREFFLTYWHCFLFLKGQTDDTNNNTNKSAASSFTQPVLTIDDQVRVSGRSRPASHPSINGSTFLPNETPLPRHRRRLLRRDGSWFAGSCCKQNDVGLSPGTIPFPLSLTWLGAAAALAPAGTCQEAAWALSPRQAAGLVWL